MRIPWSIITCVHTCVHMYVCNNQVVNLVLPIINGLFWNCYIGETGIPAAVKKKKAIRFQRALYLI